MSTLEMTVTSMQLAGNAVRMMITSYGFSNVYSKTISLPITFRNF